MLGKLFVLGATIVGIVSFFLPTLTVEMKKIVPTPGMDVGAAVVSSTGVAEVSDSADAVRVTFSAFRALSGVKGMHDAVPDAARSTDYWEALGSVVGYLALPWAPTVAFLLFSLIGIRRFGRGLGTLSLLVGAVTIVFWLLLNSVVQEESAKLAPAGSLIAEIGFTLLLVGAIAGAVGGLLALVAPQRRRSEA